MKEPRIHSHIEDMLPHAHPLAYAHTNCAKCGDLVHAGNNECMQTWVETGQGCYCLQCFNFLHIHMGEVLDDDWGLPDDGQINVVPDCDHIWIDASNKVVSGTALCLRCGKLDILANVEVCTDIEVIRDLIAANGLEGNPSRNLVESL